MSPFQSRFLFKLLTSHMPDLRKRKFSKRDNRSSRISRNFFLKTSCAVLALGSLFGAETAQAADFIWSSTAPGGNVWPGPAVESATFQAAGVTLDFTFDGDFGVTGGFSPTLGNELDDILPGDINFPVDGGQTNGNLFLGNNPTNASESLTLTVNSTNAAGNTIPLEQVEYTIIDIDRSCNRIDSTGPDVPPNAEGEIFWQDVISTRLLQNGATGITPAATNLGETVEALGLSAGASVGYTVPAGALTFRGIADPTAETLSDALGNDGCSGDTTGGGANDDNRGVEAANNGAQGDATEGNITLSSGASFVNGIEFTYGTGVLDSPANGLPGETLAENPQGHGLGVLSDFSFRPGIIGIAKSASAPVPDPNTLGNFLVTFTLNIENLGELDLSDVQVTDDLAATFPDGFTIATQPTITATSGDTTSLVANPAYDGGPTTNIFQAGGTLDDNDANGDGDIGTATVEFTVSFNPGTETNFDNQAVAQGTTPGGGLTTDLSDDGLNPDTDDNNDPTGTDQDDPTPIVITPAPSIGVTKQVLGTPVANPDGTFTITYRQIVRNLGTEVLSNVVLDDQDFSSTYRIGTATGATDATFVPGSVSVPSAAPAGFPAGYVLLTGSSTFDGTAGNLQLATVTTLPTGGYGIVDYQVVVDPTDPIDGTVENLGDGTGGASPDDDVPYESQVIAAGTGAVSSTAVTDLSDDVTGFSAAADQLPQDFSIPANGTATDPISNGVPQSAPIPANDPNAATNENNRTPVTFAGQPAIALSKRVTNVTANPDGTFDVTYRQLVQNIGPTTLDNVQITENTDILDEYRVGQPNGALQAAVQSVTALPAGSIIVPGAPGAVTLTAGSAPQLASQQTLLSGTNTLQPGEYGAVEYVVQVTPGDGTEGHGGGAAPFTAQATATGTASSLPGTPIVTDPSDDGVEFPNGTTGVTPNQVLDPDNNGTADQGDATLASIDPDGNTTTASAQDSENNPTPVRFPSIAIAKNISSVTGSGTPEDPNIVSYDVTVQNVGGILVSGVQITEDNIDEVFSDLPAGNTTVIGPVTQISGVPTTVNPSFDGEAAPQLIDPGTLLTLEPGQSSTLRYQVEVINPTNGIQYASSSTTSGTGIPSDSNGPVAGNPLVVVGDTNADGVLETGSGAALPVSDLSDDGTNPDPIPGDGNSGGGPGENDPTIVTFPVGPQIGLTKQVISTVTNPDGSVDVTFEYRVQNIGIVPLTGLDVVDNYDTQFDIGQPTAVSNYEIISVTPGDAETPDGPTLANNPGIVGGGPNSGDLSVAAVTPTIFDPGEAATTQVVVRVTPQPGQEDTVYDNAAVAAGTSTDDPTQIATDLSDDIPIAGATDPRLLTPDPGLLGAGISGQSANDATPVVFSIVDSALELFKAITFTSQTGPINTQIDGFPAGVVGSINVPEELQSGDTVEYTIYFFNNSSSSVFPNLEVCDPLPSPLTPVLPIPGGSFISPLTPLPSNGLGGSCPDGSSGSQGAAVFQVGDVAPSSNGSVVFQVQIP